MREWGNRQPPASLPMCHSTRQVGAGKSTLLLHLLGEMKPVTGQISLRARADALKVSLPVIGSRVPTGM